MPDIPDPTRPLVVIYNVAPADLRASKIFHGETGIGPGDRDRIMREGEAAPAPAMTGHAFDGVPAPQSLTDRLQIVPGKAAMRDEPGPAFMQAELTYLVQLLQRHDFTVMMPPFTEGAPAEPDAIIVLLPLLGGYVLEAKNLCQRLKQRFPRAALLQSHPIEASFAILEELREISPSYRYEVNARAICKRLSNAIFEQSLTRECALRDLSLKALNDPQAPPPPMPGIMSNPRILITGDASKDFLELKNTLQDHNFDVVSTLTVLQGLSFLENDRFDGIIIISDETKNDLVKFIHLLGKNDELSRIPILVLTLKKSLQIKRIFEYLSAGADAVLLRDEMPRALIPEISRLVSMYRHSQNLRKYLTSVIAKVTKDSVRIADRKFFDIHFRHLCRESAGQRFPLAMIAIRFSNPAGASVTDRARLKSMIYASMVTRDIDILTRLDPETLVIVCPSITQAQCELLYRRIFKIMRDLPATMEDQNGYRGLSIHASMIFHKYDEAPGEFIARSLNSLKPVKENSPYEFSPGLSVIK